MKEGKNKKKVGGKGGEKGGAIGEFQGADNVADHAVDQERPKPAGEFIPERLIFRYQEISMRMMPVCIQQPDRAGLRGGLKEEERKKER